MDDTTTMDLENEDGDTDAEYVPDKDDNTDDSDDLKASRKSINQNSSTWNNSKIPDNDSEKDTSKKTPSKQQRGKSKEFESSDEEQDSEKKPTKNTRRKSEGWKYFKVKNAITRTAICKVCKKEISYITVSNLMKHVRRTHGEIEVISSTDDEVTEIDPNAYTAKPRPQKTFRSYIWKYFNVHDPEAKVAKCKICAIEIGFRSLSNLRKHMQRKHSDVFVYGGRGASSDEEGAAEMVEVDAYTDRPRPQKSFRSFIWKYFDVHDAENKIANCKICANKLVFKSLTNLKKHMQRKHNDVLVYAAGASSDEEGVSGVGEVEQNTAVWAFFKCLDETLKIASCLICKMRVDYNDEHDLTRHLKRKHPRMDLEGSKIKPKKLMITESGEIYEIDESPVKQEQVQVQNDNGSDSDDWVHNNNESDGLNMVEYLDDNIFEEPQYTPPKKKLKLTPSKPKQIKYTKILQTTQDESSLDIFGKYIVSLLKNLPKSKSDQLQAEFIKQIMEVKILHEQDTSKSQSNVVQNTRYSSPRLNDDTRVTSNSDVQRVITIDRGEIQHSVTDNEQ